MDKNQAFLWFYGSGDLRKITSSVVCVFFILTLLLISAPFHAVHTVPYSESNYTYGFGETAVGSANAVALTKKDLLETIVSQVNETKFKWFDSILANTIGPRPYDLVSNMEAAEFIADELNSTGSIFATYQWFTCADKEIANVIGTLPSADPGNQSKIVVGAHFDTVSDSPGVDDNGSGTALLLEVARVFSRCRFGCAIEFVAFNAEENGLLGSKHYAQQALQSGEDILLVINIDMCIWDNPDAPPNEKIWIVYDGTVPYGDCERFADSTLETGYTYVTAPIQKISSTNDTYVSVKNWLRSDQASFWAQGIPALWIFEFNGFQNPYIHKPADSMDVESYNFTLGAQVARVVTATVAKLANPLIVDFVPPTLWIVSPSVGYKVKSSKLTVTWIGSDAESGIDHYEVKLDEGGWSNIGNNTSYNLTKLDDGSHTVYVKAVDRIGNSIEDSVNFTVDTTVFPLMWAVIIALVPASIVSVAVVYFLRKKKPLTSPHL